MDVEPRSAGREGDVCLCLKGLACRVSAGPGPLKIIAAEPPGDVHGFADRIEARDAFGHHCLRRQPGGRDAANGDLCLGEAFGAIGVESPARQPRRSEEHTSELQSLMRISYAVFCLKKKNKT